MKKKVQFGLRLFKKVRLYYTLLTLKVNFSGAQAQLSQSPLGQRKSFPVPHASSGSRVVQACDIGYFIHYLHLLVELILPLHLPIDFIFQFTLGSTNRTTCRLLLNVRWILVSAFGWKYSHVQQTAKPGNGRLRTEEGRAI
jgi:hypothetical protein